jgi:hypothetical protein
LVDGISGGIETDEKGQIEVLDFEEAPKWLHAGQKEAWAAEENEILILSGRQSGKTILIAYWLLREVQRKGPGDYMLVGPTLELLNAKCLPGCLNVWENVYKLGSYNKSEKTFNFSMTGIAKMFGTIKLGDLVRKFGWRTRDNRVQDPDFEVKVRIRAAYATDPTTLESATVKGVAADECGQPKFMAASYEALIGRRAVYRARLLMATTPYDLGWVKGRIYDPCKESGLPKGYEGRYCEGSTGEKITIRFESWLNPAFGREKFEAIRRGGTPKWMFDLFYRAIFTRPAGAIYDTFDPVLNTCQPFRVPPDWPRVLGIDFGDINKASCHIAIDPTSPVDRPMCYVYCTYRTKGKSVPEHIDTILLREKDEVIAVGGAVNEDEKREQFGDCGLYVSKPTVSSVPVGIDAIYMLLTERRLIIFDTLNAIIKEITDYSRELDGNGDPIPNTIADKHRWHRCDALRYAGSEIVNNPGFWTDTDEGGTDLTVGTGDRSSLQNEMGW